MFSILTLLRVEYTLKLQKDYSVGSRNTVEDVSGGNSLNLTKLDSGLNQSQTFMVGETTKTTTR